MNCNQGLAQGWTLCVVSSQCISQDLKMDGLFSVLQQAAGPASER